MFKRTELEPDIFAGMLDVFAKHGAAEKATAGFMKALSKASNFEMLFMFAEDADKEHIKTIGDGLSSVDAALGKEFMQSYDK